MGQALTDLERDLLQQNADFVARDLAELSEFIDSLREQLQRLEGEQRELIAEELQSLSDPAFEQYLKEQAELDAEAAERLAETRELLDQDRPRELPAQTPHDGPRRDEETSDRDSGEPGKKADLRSGMGRAGSSQNAQGRERKSERVRSHQQEQADKLRAADGSLQGDQQSLEQLREQYDAQLPAEAFSQLTPDQISELTDLMLSEATEEALDMFQRMRKMLAEADAQALQDANESGEAHGGSSMEAPFGHFLPAEDTVEDLMLEFGDLGTDARTMIMMMQPKEREELLQGLREEGPDGYRQFIRDYYRRLTRAGTRSP
jgi:hypothetical protein